MATYVKDAGWAASRKNAETAEQLLAKRL